MAVSEVQIAKLALSHLGDRYDITSLDEASPEAEQVSLVFDNCRDQLLREHPWKFSLRYYTPSSLIGTPPAGWAEMFAYPPDGLKVWRIVNPLDPQQDRLPPLPFTIARNADDIKVLLTNEEEPEFEYSKKVTNSFDFDAIFDMALSWRIAALIAMPITGDGGIRDMVKREAMAETARAKVEDGNEGISRKQTRDPDWIRARGSSELSYDRWA